MDIAYAPEVQNAVRAAYGHYLDYNYLRKSPLEFLDAAASATSDIEPSPLTAALVEMELASLDGVTDDFRIPMRAFFRMDATQKELYRSHRVMTEQANHRPQTEQFRLMLEYLKQYGVREDEQEYQ